MRQTLYEEGCEFFSEAVIKGRWCQFLGGRRLIGSSQRGQGVLKTDPEAQYQHPEQGHRVDLPVSLDQSDVVSGVFQPLRREHLVQHRIELLVVFKDRIIQGTGPPKMLFPGGNIRHREGTTPLFERLITRDKAVTMGDSGIIEH